jgi:protein-disulfide isomerase
LRGNHHASAWAFSANDPSYGSGLINRLPISRPLHFVRLSRATNKADADGRQCTPAMFCHTPPGKLGGHVMDMTEWAPALALPVSPGRDHIRGAENAAVVLLEYGDYQCSYCGAAHPVVKAIQQEMGADLQFVFRQFPLSTLHPMAESAAEAAEAAGAQGKFWDLHDMIYENQDRLDIPSLLAFAAAIRLDVERFVGELERGVHTEKVREDLLSGVRSGVHGTPTFFINGRRYEGSWAFPNLLGVLKTAAAERNAA